MISLLLKRGVKIVRVEFRHSCADMANTLGEKHIK